MYTYYNLQGDIAYLKHFCVDTGSIGKSVLGRDIFFVHVGGYKAEQIIITGGIHAREHVSSLLVTKQIVHILNSGAYADLKERGIYFIPMVNPDGNLICAYAHKSVPVRFRKRLKKINGGRDFRLFKANANGVDLNVNFDARWGEGKYNLLSMGSENYIGPFPFSEPETRALRDFTLSVSPIATLSYHAMGRELYWQFGQNEEDMKRDGKIANYINSHLGYRMVPDNGTSVGGYKDWCISALKIPSFTIELVSDKEYSHPLTDDKCIDEDFEKNKELPQNLLNFTADMIQ